MGIVYHGSKRARLLLLFPGVRFWCGRLSQVCFRICARCLRRGGRQDSGISLGFCLLLPPRAPISVGAVDKIQAFCSVFVYFCLHELCLRWVGKQNSGILLGFCRLLPPRALHLTIPQTRKKAPGRLQQPDVSCQISNI